MYHRIDALRPGLPPITRALTVDPATFAREMQYLAAHGYHTLDMRELYCGLEQGCRLPARPVVVTFDDGYRDVLVHAAPVLHRLGQHATMFVITGRVSGPDPSFLRWRDLLSLERLGVEIGSHTVTHADLPALPAAQARLELVDSRLALERRLGRPVQWLAYPYGHTDAAVVALARAAGYVLGLTTRSGYLQPAADPLLLRRYEVRDTTSLAAFAALVSSSAG
jgi:peptidoglycan/xylan/chitin deacetylase (PgdA/CDA1 family)